MSRASQRNGCIEDAAEAIVVEMALVSEQNGQQLVGTFRRFEYGPVYQVVAVRGEGAKAVADIELPESGQKATIPLADVLASPKAD